MFKVLVHEPIEGSSKNKLVAIHKYPTMHEAEISASSLHNFPNKIFMIQSKDYKNDSGYVTKKILFGGYKTSITTK
jgi:hypothetical protein